MKSAEGLSIPNFKANSFDVEAEIKSLENEIEQTFSKINSDFNNSLPTKKKFSPPTISASPKNIKDTPLEIPHFEKSQKFVPAQKNPDVPKFTTSISPRNKTENIEDRANSIRQHHKNLGQKVLAAILIASTAATVASGIRRDKKDNAVEYPTYTISTETSNQNESNYNIEETSEKISINIKPTESEGLTTNFNPQNETTEAQESTKTQTERPLEYIENNGNKIEMDMDIKLNLTDSMREELNRIKQIYQQNIETYRQIANTVKESTALNIPPEMICAIHYRESGCDFTRYLHNGQKLGKTTTLVPAGIYFENFAPAAVDALKREISQFNYNTKRFHLKNDLSTLSSIAMFTETFNGTGARDYHNSASSYVYSGTNEYQGGMYVKDGKFSSTTKDSRVGTLPIFLALTNTETANS